MGDGKVSKLEAIFRPPQREKKSMRTLFSVRTDGKISEPEAIFRPPLTKSRLYDVVFLPPWTYEDCD